MQNSTGTAIGVPGPAIGVPGLRPCPGYWLAFIYILELTRATRAQALSYILHEHQTSNLAIHLVIKPYLYLLFMRLPHIANFEYTQSTQACRLLGKKVLQRCRCPLGGVYRGPNMYSHSIMSSATDAHVKACSIPPQILGSSYAHEDLENTKTNNKVLPGT